LVNLGRESRWNKSNITVDHRKTSEDVKWTELAHDRGHSALALKQEISTLAKEPSATQDHGP
jgi:hypothetical protein